MDDTFGRLFQARLKIKPRKCRLFQCEIEYLGHVISGEGVKVNPQKISASKDWPVPECVTDRRSFLGTASYYQKCIVQFATIAAPLHELTGGGKTFQWTEACQEAFNQLKTALSNASVFNFLVEGAKFVLDTDASHRGIGAVLNQLIPVKTPDGSEAYEERVFSYASRILSPHKKRYCTTRKSCSQKFGSCGIIDPTYAGRTSSSERIIRHCNGSAPSGSLKAKSPDGYKYSASITLKFYTDPASNT